MFHLRYIVHGLFLTVILMGLCCGRRTTDEGSVPPPTNLPTFNDIKYVYLTSGTTYAGAGVPLSTPSNTVVRYNNDGTSPMVLVDYTQFPGDSPVAAVHYDAKNLLVAVENVTNPAARRIDRVAKDGGGFNTFLLNATTFGSGASTLNDLSLTPDGGFLISKGRTSPNGVIEKFSSTKARLLILGNPYITNPGGSCATSRTHFSRAIAGPGGTIIALHSAASPNNKIILVNKNGYTSPADCLAAVAGPSASHYPTALLYHSSGKLLVAFGNNSGQVHEVYAYSVSPNSITGETRVYRDLSVLQGISSMTELPDGTILVSAASSTFNSVEHFAYDTGANELVRLGSTPFIAPSVFTKSVSGIAADN